MQDFDWLKVAMILQLFVSVMFQRVREINLNRKWLRAYLRKQSLSNGLHFSSAETNLLLEHLSEDFTGSETCFAEQKRRKWNKLLT